MLTLEQQAARHRLIQKICKQKQAERAKQFTNRRRDFEEKLDLKRMGIL
tara:strand:+ start:1308 stop:1454 length:147 start_codon:yes stop_codon:yes gene_type:complete